MIKNTIVRVNIVPERYLKELNIGFYECKIDSDERTVTICSVKKRMNIGMK